ncbi:MAG: polysaccharide biosynthesis/export family protein [Gemmatales bacterium]|nr:polysaccharide biosynthesis/export family protein [Gemmatales bacterium]MDW8386181.1 polysaccharide biosynthesis/export family protein [Gemmatales bacterium]
MLCALAGCATPRTATVNTLASHPPKCHGVGQYRVGSPDVLDIEVTDRPDLSGTRRVEVNGCVNMGPLGGIRVEGLTPAQIEERIAQAAGVSPENVSVRVVEFASQQVYLFGEVTGQQRAVPYQGPETVVDLLRRTGGITQDSAPEEVRVVRPACHAGEQPQVFQVDLKAILLQGDERTNLHIQPYDQIHVPESRACRIGKCLHPWLRPFVRILTGDS